MPQLEKKNNVCEIQVIKYQNAEILGILKISYFRETKDFLLNCVYQYQKEGTVGEQVSTVQRQFKILFHLSHAFELTHKNT